MNDIWKTFINDEMKKEYMVKLIAYIKKEREEHQVYPEPHALFNAFALCDYYDLKVVILGQDPYHTPLTAHGLAFSSLQGYTPPSLVNIFQEIKEDVFSSREFSQTRLELFPTNNLTCWAKQGVLLLNTILTVRKGEANSHKNKGWEQFTEAVIKKLNSHPDRIVYMLWGNNAKAYAPLIDREKHLVLEAVHPSPMAANQGGWFGCKHFSQANAFINKHYFNKKVGINWSTIS